MHVPGQRGRAAITADLGGRNRVGLIVRAKTAVLFGNGDAKKTGAVQILVIFAREFCFAVIGCRAAGEHRLAEFARGRNDRGLFVVEAERLVIDVATVEETLSAMQVGQLTSLDQVHDIDREARARAAELAARRARNHPA